MTLPRDLDLTTVTDTFIDVTLTNLDKRHDELERQIDKLKEQQKAIGDEVELFVKEKVRRELGSPPQPRKSYTMR